MKLSLSWLQEYINLQVPPAQIAKLLTAAGLEVDGMEQISLSFSGVVVGRIVDVDKHPNADKLCIAAVTDGQKTYQVVCGAPNCRVGLKTAFAPVGATLRDKQGRSFLIEPVKLRGIESFGMLCAADELGLSGENGGIMEFPSNTQEGILVADLYQDTIFEISLTPNLGHCSSVIGVARELSAITGTPLRLPVVMVEEVMMDPIEDSVTVKIENIEKCPRYTCRLIKNVIVAPSPEWMQKRLLSCGIRPINNIVDISNYVSMEMGHPLHAFDFKKMKGGSVDVKCAEEGDLFITHDGKERTLNKDDLLIWDEEKPVALAGIMGGENSEVNEQTTEILLEAAYFHPGMIRKTSKRLGLQTDASKRFERGCDPNILIPALDRAAMLMTTITGGQVLAGFVDVKEKEFLPKVISLRPSRVNAILGLKLGLSEVEDVFRRLNFPIAWEGQIALKVTVPTYRNDVTSEIDLIEEVARIYGYDNITLAAAKYQTSPLPHAPIFLMEREVRTRLIAEGLQEFLTCDLIGPTLTGIVKDLVVPEEAIIKVMNPTSIEQSILRTTLMPGLLQLIKYNYDHQIQNISGFEVGRIHFKKGDKYKEQSVVGLIMTGKSTQHHWDEKALDVDFFDLKGILENLLKELNIHSAVFKSNQLPIFHSGRQAAIYVDKLEIGSLGEINPGILRRLDVPQRIYFAEINLHDLIKVRNVEQKMQELSKYPGSERDWTLMLKEEIPIQIVFDLIHQAAKEIKSPLLEDVILLDIYRSEAIGKDNKNVTLRFIYRDKTKTIEQETVETEHKRIVTTVLKALEQANETSIK